MTGRPGTVGITGARGYLGSLLMDELQRRGIPTVPLSRNPEPSGRRFVLGDRGPDDLLDGLDGLIHCAYDMSLRRETDIWSVNVEGSRHLLELARKADVRRVIVLSSMSAYEGTTQLYGRAKLSLEAHAADTGALAVRPGIVYGPGAGGMAGALTTLTRLPLVPLVAARAHQFTVHQADFAAALAALLATDEDAGVPIGLANPEPVAFETLVRGLGHQAGRRVRALRVDWRLLHAGLRVAERMGLSLPFRADSLLGLAHPAPSVPGQDVWARLGLTFRRFGQPVPVGPECGP
jgi:nucleoside-diphosphate-sugar epimerase